MGRPIGGVVVSISSRRKGINSIPSSPLVAYFAPML